METYVTASPGRDTDSSPTPTARIYQFPTTREGGQFGDQRSPLYGTGTSPRRWPVSSVAMDWAWTRPVDGPRLLVLLALAKRVRPKTEQASPSMPELVHMTGLSETTVREHVQALATAGVIKVDVSSGGRNKRSTYTLPGCLTPRETWGSKPAKTPREKTPKEPQTPRMPSTNPPADAPAVLRTESGTRGVQEAAPAADFAENGVGLFDEPVTEASIARQRTKVAQAIASRYCELEPMSKYVNVLGIVKRPLENDRFTGEMVMAAVEQIAQEQRPLTLETLRIQLVGLPPRSSSQAGRAPLRERLRGAS